MVEFIARPSNKLKIKHNRVLDAYFAKLEDKVEYEKVKETYTVKAGDYLSKIAKQKKTTLTKLKKDNKLKNDTIKVGDTLTIESQKEKGRVLNFKRLNDACLGDEVYVIVKTHNLHNHTVAINVKQGKTDNPELHGSNNALMLGKNTKASVKVGAYAHDKSIVNKEEFTDWAIFKITLGSEDNQKEKEIIEKLTDKKAYLFLLVDAHSLNNIEVAYNGANEDKDGALDQRTTPNYWLDMDGKWFELKSSVVIEYNIYYNGTIEKTDVKNPIKAIYNYFDSKNKKHNLGETEIYKTKKHIRKDVLTKKDDNILLVYSKSIQKYSSGNVKFGFATWNSDSQRWYINPECFAGLLGAMIEESIEDLGFNGFSIKDGNTAGGSSSHINGEKGDLRYLSKNENGERTELVDNHFDYDRQVRFNNALYKFGWGRKSKMYSENFDREVFMDVFDKKTKKKTKKKMKEETLLPHTKHMKKITGKVKYRHHHHLHLTGFDFSKIKKI